MISTKHRFHGYGSLRHVYASGSTIRGPLFSVRTLANPRRQDYRLAVVISRKVHKSAVARNKMRRRLYEAVRTIEKQISGPHDIVLTVFHDSVLEEPASSLNRQIIQQFQAAGVLSKRP